MKTTDKVNKKAWKSIKKIMNASTMVEVEYAINDALLDTFGLRHLGLMKISMNNPKPYKPMQIVYGCHTYNNFELLKAMRNYNLEMYGIEVKKYLITFIPNRMKKSIMYQKLVA